MFLFHRSTEKSPGTGLEIKNKPIPAGTVFRRIHRCRTKEIPRSRSLATEPASETPPRPKPPNPSTPSPAWRATAPTGAEGRGTPRCLAAGQGRNRKRAPPCPGRHQQSPQVRRREVRRRTAGRQGQPGSRPGRTRADGGQLRVRRRGTDPKQLVSAFEKNALVEVEPAGENSIPTGTRRSAWSIPSRNRTPWSPCCRRATSSPSGPAPALVMVANAEVLKIGE